LWRGSTVLSQFRHQTYFSSDSFCSLCCISAASECPRNGVLRGSNGTFTSPGHPLAYPVSVSCTWIIEVPENYQVQLTFTTFQLENCAVPSLCTCDHVEVRDGLSASSRKLKELCGDKIPRALRSSGRYLWVEFESDSETVGNGFSAFFEAVRKYGLTKYTITTSMPW